MISRREANAAPIGVMHMSDTLEAGGTERVAVNLVNHLPRDEYELHLCTTRRDGPLEELIASDVGRLRLARQRRFDARAVRRLIEYIRRNQIRILHAHSSSVFIAAAASMFDPHPFIIWHDHYGRYEVQERHAWLYRLAKRRVNAVIAVNESLAQWSRSKLSIPTGRVWYIPNFACEAARESTPQGELPELPGTSGERIVCIANFREQKDHLTLVRAMALVVPRIPNAHLLLVGDPGDGAYLKVVRGLIAQHGLERHISILGQRRDVGAILHACDVGVLSSASEGLPLALIEYGLGGLAAIATRVGQCAEVLDNGRAGILVSPAAPEQLAGALMSLLQSPSRRATLGDRFRRRTQEVYSARPVIEKITQVYQTVVANNGTGH